MPLTRIIPVLQIERDSLVKTCKFRDPRYLGDPINAVTIFNQKEADELIIVDIAASRNGHEPNLDFLSDIASQAFMPLAYGGGVTSMKQVRAIFNAGFEKIVIGSSNYSSLDLISEAAAVFGSQSVVGAMDVKKSFLGRYEVWSHSATVKEGYTPVEWAEKLEAAGAGELFVTSVDRESTWKGYDLELMAEIVESTNIPVVANGGAGSLSDMLTVKTKANVSGVAAGSFFVYHGKHRAVLITYPTQSELESMFGEV